jgi:hypothetical protein
MAGNGTIAGQTTDRWMPDPSGRHQFRWWNGAWTDAVADGSVTGTDPLGPPTVAPSAPPLPGWAPGPAVAAHGTAAQARTPRRVPVVGALVAGAGAVTAVVGALLPWATVTGITDIAISGTEDGRDGVVTLALAVIVGIVVVVMAAARSRVAAVAVAVAGVLMGLVAAYDISNVKDVPAAYGDLVQVNVGSGLWLTLAAGLAIVVGGLIGVARR